MEAFQLKQREFARREKPFVQSNPVEQAKAEEVLKGFFSAMENWIQKKIENQGNKSDIYNLRYDDDIHLIADKFCTEKPVKTERLTGSSYQVPSENTFEQIIDAEWHSSRQLYLYTKNSLWRYRYRLVRHKEQWRIDRREIFLDGWTNTCF